MLEVDCRNKWFRPAETPPEKSPPGPHGDVDEGPAETGNAKIERQFIQSCIWTCLRPEGSPLLPSVFWKCNFIGSHHLLAWWL